MEQKSPVHVCIAVKKVKEWTQLSQAAVAKQL